MPRSRSVALLSLALVGAPTLAGCTGQEPATRTDASADATGTLTRVAVERGMPSVVAVSVTRGGDTITGTGTLLVDGYVVTDATFVAGAAAVEAAVPTPAPTPRPTATPAPTTTRAPTATATPAPTSPRTPTSTPAPDATPAGTTPRATSTPTPSAPGATPTPMRAPRLAAPPTITVRVASGDEFPGTLEGLDAVSGLAVLRVDGLDELPIARGASDPELGQPVAAVAYLSARRPAVRPGTLVTIGRAVRRNRQSEVGLMEATAPLGTQALGGPLVGADGRVVGITTRSLASLVPGTVVALPYDSALRITKALVDGGRVRRAFLGLDTVGVTPNRARELQLSTATGVLIRSIVPASPAAFSTLRGPTGMTRIDGRIVPRGSDVITRIDGEPVKEPEDLEAALATKKPGQRIALQVIRGDRGMTIRVTLGER